MRRMKARRNDRKIFRRVASKAKAINVSPKMYRGGIRL